LQTVQQHAAARYAVSATWAAAGIEAKVFGGRKILMAIRIERHVKSFSLDIWLART